MLQASKPAVSLSLSSDSRHAAATTQMAAVRAFNCFNRSGSGALSLEEFITALARLDVPLAAGSSPEAAFKDADLDADNKLDLTDWTDWVESSPAAVRRVQLLFPPVHLRACDHAEDAGLIKTMGWFSDDVPVPEGTPPPLLPSSPSSSPLFALS